MTTYKFVIKLVKDSDFQTNSIGHITVPDDKVVFTKERQLEISYTSLNPDFYVHEYFNFPVGGTWVNNKVYTCYDNDNKYIPASNSLLNYQSTALYIFVELEKNLNSLSGLVTIDAAKAMFASFKARFEQKLETRLSTYSPTVANSSITTTKLATGAVTSEKIAANAITEAKLAVGLLTPKANSIGTNELKNGSVTAAKLGSDISLTPANNSITSAMIQSGAVTADKLASDIQVGGGGLDDATLTMLQRCIQGDLVYKNTSQNITKRNISYSTNVDLSLFSKIEIDLGHKFTNWKASVTSITPGATVVISVEELSFSRCVRKTSIMPAHSSHNAQFYISTLMFARAPTSITATTFDIYATLTDAIGSNTEEESSRIVNMSSYVNSPTHSAESSPSVYIKAIRFYPDIKNYDTSNPPPILTLT